MQILAERYYKTRGGDRAYVSAVEDSSKVPNGSRPRMCPILGYLKGASVAWYCNGSFRMDGKEDAWDLLEEWKEPVVVSKRYLLMRNLSIGGLLVAEQGTCTMGFEELGSGTLTITEGVFN